MNNKVLIFLTMAGVAIANTQFEADVLSTYFNKVESSSDKYIIINKGNAYFYDNNKLVDIATMGLDFKGKAFKITSKSITEMSDIEIQEVGGCYTNYYLYSPSGTSYKSFYDTGNSTYFVVNGRKTYYTNIDHKITICGSRYLTSTSWCCNNNNW